MIDSILVPLITVGLAEFGDKSQLTVLNLATRTKNHLALLIGVILAFSVVDGIAIILGGWITNFIPISLIKIISGVIFIIFGIMALRKKDEKVDKINSKKDLFISSFLLIFFSEWGDKTQLASALFATKYNPWLVFIGVILSMSILSLMAIFIGKYLFERVNKKQVTFLSGIIFIVLGISFLIFRS